MMRENSILGRSQHRATQDEPRDEWTYKMWRGVPVEEIPMFVAIYDRRVSALRGQHLRLASGVFLDVSGDADDGG